MIKYNFFNNFNVSIDNHFSINQSRSILSTIAIKKIQTTYSKDLKYLVKQVTTFR